MKLIIIKLYKLKGGVDVLLRNIDEATEQKLVEVKLGEMNEALQLDIDTTPYDGMDWNYAVVEDVTSPSPELPCSKCGYDMGEGYKNCGASEDGVCPECGHDKPSQEKREVAVHQRHCSVHWCKYGEDATCPVVQGEVKDGLPETKAHDTPQERIWNVEVSRTETRHKTIVVKATTEEEAYDNAMEQAGNEDYGSVSSGTPEYEVTRSF